MIESNRDSSAIETSDSHSDGPSDEGRTSRQSTGETFATTNGASGIWSEEFKIHSYEIGPSGCASPQAIGRFLQEAASNHASNLDVSAEEMARHKQMWVLSNLSLRMTSYPRWHDKICIETWPVSKGSGVRGYRDFTVRDQNEQVLGRASSMWLLLNRENRRPLKIPSWLIEVAGAGHDVEILHQVKEEDFTGSAQVSQEFVIRGSDIDWNMHVNNVCYLEWALEAVPAKFRLANKITDLDISFVSEGKHGNSVVTECFSPTSTDQPYLHKIVEKSSSKLLAMLKIRWQPKESTSTTLDHQSHGEQFRM